MMHWDIINFLCSKFNKPRYLEIGSQRRDCFNKIQAELKHDIEPQKNKDFIQTFNMNSDKAFESMSFEQKYDVVFVDGLHNCDQVLSDVKNVSKHLDEKGFIVVHDCLPTAEFQTVREPIEQVPWTGDVWKAQAWLVKNFKNVWTIPTDWGCGIINGPLEYDIVTLEELNKLTWNDFLLNKNDLLRIISWTEFWVKL